MSPGIDIHRKCQMQLVLFSLLAVLRYPTSGVTAFATPGVELAMTSKRFSTPSLSSQSSFSNLFHANPERRTALLRASIPGDQDRPVEQQDQQKERSKSSHLLIPMLTFLTSISSFLLVNQFVGPWPEQLLRTVPYALWMTMHLLAGMVFGGGVLVTTCIEWLAVGEKKNGDAATRFWFDQVPTLDAWLVVPALGASIVSGTALAVQNYEWLGAAPLHIRAVLHTLTFFGVWWAATDLPTQGRVLPVDSDGRLSRIVWLRRASNLISCLLVVLLYALMTLKPGMGYFGIHS